MKVDIDSLRLHPDSERVPMAHAPDLAALRESLSENGQQDPIDATPEGLILDGRTRWKLLRELGARTVEVREVVIPEAAQTNYIVDRALARRHLTTEQKRALNALLRSVVVQVTKHPATGEEMRIGKGASQRAATLGIDRDTVTRWDREEAGAANTAAAPTHQIYEDGRVRPIHLPPRSTPDRAPSRQRAAKRPAPLRKDRPIPAWSRHFSLFCRRSRPEDREFLLRMAREIHAALRQNDIEYEES